MQDTQQHFYSSHRQRSQALLTCIKHSRQASPFPTHPYPRVSNRQHQQTATSFILYQQQHVHATATRPINQSRPACNNNRDFQANNPRYKDNASIQVIGTWDNSFQPTTTRVIQVIGTGYNSFQPTTSRVFQIIGTQDTSFQPTTTNSYVIHPTTAATWTRNNNSNTHIYV